MPVAPLVPDSVFADRYRVLAPAAEDGETALYAVQHLSLGKMRSLLLLDPAIVADPADRARFEGKPWEAMKVDPEHFAEILDSGVEGDTPWIAMKLLAGEDLAAKLRRMASFSAADRRASVEQPLRDIAAVLSAAHDAGFVHGDLRPENVFVQHHHEVLLLGLGVAPPALRPGVVDRSRMQWIAPEQIQGGPVGPAADVFTFGLLAFLLLTGHRYWRFERGDEVSTEPFLPASDRARLAGAAACVPRSLDGWFERCLNADPAARFPSAVEAFADLEVLLQMSFSEPAILANPKGSFYDRGLAEPPTTSTRISLRPRGPGGPYRGSLQQPPERQVILANPKGSHYDDGLSGRRRRVIPLALALVAAVIAAIVLLARR